ncbi:MAG: hypothetical protein WC209_07235 [Ignavibacteriaceae bacterium]
MIEEAILGQIQFLIELGFPKLLNLSIEDYLNSFQYKGNRIPPNCERRFDLPVIVDPRIPTAELILKAGLANYLKLEELTNVSNSYAKPYLFFTHDSKKYSSHTAASAITTFVEDEAGCTLEELIYFYLFYSDKFEGIAIDAILTNFRGDYHPCLIKVTEKGEIGAHWHNDLTVGINIISKGKSIIKL